MARTDTAIKNIACAITSGDVKILVAASVHTERLSKRTSRMDMGWGRSGGCHHAALSSSSIQLSAGTFPPVSRSILKANSKDGFFLRCSNIDKYEQPTPRRAAKSARETPRDLMACVSISSVTNSEVSASSRLFTNGNDFTSSLSTAGGGERHSSSMKLKIRQHRKSAGLTIEKLSEMVDISPSYLSMIERGAHNKKPSSKLIGALADALGVAPGAIFDTRNPVAVAGRVGAGSTVQLVDAYAKGDGLYHVAAPDDLPSSGVVAVEVVGDSMSPLIEEGDIIFFTRNFVGVGEDVINHVGICQTDCGRALVKQIKRGREEGTFDLFSVNPNNPPEYGIKLVWAAPWRRILRRQDVEQVDTLEVEDRHE